MPKKKADPLGLTQREIQVLAALIKLPKPTNKAIGAALGISVNTVATHLHAVSLKAAVTGRKRLAAWAKGETVP